MGNPNVIILAGPNGAGKSTISQQLLSSTLKIPHFVNADTIARGLSAFHSESMAIKAGRIMLEHLHELAKQRADFALETTLASRTFSPWIADLKKSGYVFHLFFIYVPSAEVSIQRVSDRVSRGGHHVPDETIRRRYRRGLENFFNLFQPQANLWRMYDNSNPITPKIIAEGDGIMQTVHDEKLWQALREEYCNEK
jgi:predicted ABC-type ATPase